MEYPQQQQLVVDVSNQVYPVLQALILKEFHAALRESVPILIRWANSKPGEEAAQVYSVGVAASIAVLRTLHRLYAKPGLFSQTGTGPALDDKAYLEAIHALNSLMTNLQGKTQAEILEAHTAIQSIINYNINTRLALGEVVADEELYWSPD